jgi:hypothetical protein
MLPSLPNRLQSLDGLVRTRYAEQVEEQRNNLINGGGSETRHASQLVAPETGIVEFLSVWDAVVSDGGEAAEAIAGMREAAAIMRLRPRTIGQSPKTAPIRATSPSLKFYGR